MSRKILVYGHETLTLTSTRLRFVVVILRELTPGDMYTRWVIFGGLFRSAHEPFLNRLGMDLGVTVNSRRRHPEMKSEI